MSTRTKKLKILLRELNAKDQYLDKNGKIVYWKDKDGSIRSSKRQAFKIARKTFNIK